MYGDKPSLRLKSNSYCLTCQSPEQYPVVCVPSLGWGNRAGKNLSPGEAQAAGGGRSQHSVVAFAYAVPRLLALLVKIYLHGPRNALILSWTHLPSASISPHLQFSVLHSLQQPHVL